ncbi:MAG TPA: FG-GAP-like repeat-containing protein [Gemmatimonadales bacterium]|nr:FG-GAP-like repeat-containing protein [Gemmatimonadales bacterium]
MGTLSRTLALLIAVPVLATAQGPWREDPAPFPVLDTAGVAFATPFLGGFDIPRPQLVDIDGDGDLDLFVQERSNALMFFENVGGRHVFRSARYQDLEIHEWYRFVDLDGDGRLDLLSESPYSHIRAWRNVGTREAARFTLAADSLRDADGAPIYADRQNILNVVDIDGNGLLDLFIGRVEGNVNRWEAVGPAVDGLPRFRLLQERWEGISIIGNVQTMPAPNRPTSRHGANTMAFADLDRDGDLDLLWGDFFEPGILLIENVGTPQEPNLKSTPRQFPPDAPLLTTGYNAPAPGDVDGDGLLDLLLGVIGGAYQPARSSVDNLFWLRQVGPGRWEVASRRLIPTLDAGNESVPTLADVDGDGDLDLLLGNKIDSEDTESGRVLFVENIGTRTAPRFQERGPLPIRGEFHPSPAVGDLNGDGLPDLLVGGWRDVLQLWTNTGSRTAPSWTLADTALVRITRGSNTVPALSDLDGDGLLDLVVGEASGALNLYRNVGSRTAPRFELVSDEFQAIDTGRRSAPSFADVDGDGRMDLLLGAEDGHLELWRNVTSGTTIRFERDTTFALVADRYSAPAAGDLDGDGRVELLVGGMSGGIRHYRR